MKIAIFQVRTETLNENNEDSRFLGKLLSLRVLLLLRLCAKRKETQVSLPVGLAQLEGANKIKKFARSIVVRVSFS